MSALRGGAARRRSKLLVMLVCAFMAWLVSSVAVHAATADGTVSLDGLLWAVSTNGEDVSWNAANTYCTELALAGHDDWRLPTLEEVASLYEENEGVGGIRSPFELPGCCLWSSTDLSQVEPEVGGGILQPSGYRWGFLFEGGIRYYSAMGFPDGQALCIRDPAGGG